MKTRVYLVAVDDYDQDERWVFSTRAKAEAFIKDGGDGSVALWDIALLDICESRLDPESRALRSKGGSE